MSDKKQIEELSSMPFDDIKSLIGTTEIIDTNNLTPAEVLKLINDGFTPCPF